MFAVRRLAAAFTLAISLTGHAHTWSVPANWAHVPEPKVTKDIVYFAPGDRGYTPTSQILDVYQSASTPSGQKAPVLVYIHGGAWNHGQRPQNWQGFRAWLDAGFSVVSIDYRLLAVAPAPAAVQDARCVLSWIKRNAAKFNFDTSRIVTYGTSSGAHLALMAAILPPHNDIDLPQCSIQPHVAAVLDFYGPYHLEKSHFGAFKSPSTARWMGPDPQPSLEAKEHAMSPSTYIRAGLPPVFIAHGNADPVVPYASSQQLHADLNKAGVRNHFDTVPGGGHGKWTAEEKQRVQLDSLQFLQAVGIIQ